MSSRNRGRGTSNQDADEERRLWKEIADRAKEVDVMVARSNAIGAEIIELETQICALIDSNQSTTAADEKLEKLYRENVKICEEVQHTFEGQSNSTNLLDSINILAGLRGASEESALSQAASQPSRAASSKLSRPKKAAASKAGTVTPAIVTTEDKDSHEDVSAAPSPRIHLSTAGRLGANAKEAKAAASSSRANSVAATRETSVKAEQNDGAESVASSTDAQSVSTTHTANKASTAGSLSGGRPTNRLVLRLGEIVFCRHDFKSAAAAKPAGADMPEGEGILCRVTNVIGEGKQRRYEVQDADTSGDPLPPPQRASVSQLIQIPGSNKGLSDLPKGKGVLAQYPDTTTFYKAELSEAWKGVRRNEAGPEPGLVRLGFQDDEVVREVERRFVLTEK